LRETDLWDFQRQLDRIDEARVDGNFLDALGRPAEIYEQRVSCVSVSLEYPRADRTADTTLPAQEELCADLPASPHIGTGLRSSAPDLQPADNSTEVSPRSEEAWGCLIAARTLSV
jgi:hypothetical protein